MSCVECPIYLQYLIIGEILGVHVLLLVYIMPLLFTQRSLKRRSVRLFNDCRMPIACSHRTSSRVTATSPSIVEAHFISKRYKASPPPSEHQLMFTLYTEQNALVSTFAQLKQNRRVLYSVFHPQTPCMQNSYISNLLATCQYVPDTQ